MSLLVYILIGLGYCAFVFFFVWLSFVISNKIYEKQLEKRIERVVRSMLFGGVKTGKSMFHCNCVDYDLDNEKKIKRR